MKEKVYHIELNGNIIGSSKLEFADVSMGIIFGKINFINIKSPYHFLREYCIKNKIVLNDNDNKLCLLDTQIIPNLKIYSENKINIETTGISISGMNDDVFQIFLYGINSKEMQNKFSNHFENYYKTGLN